MNDIMYVRTVWTVNDVLENLCVFGKSIPFMAQNDKKVLISPKRYVFPCSHDVIDGPHCIIVIEQQSLIFSFTSILLMVFIQLHVALISL